MKKLNIFLMMALALSFTSCEEEWVEATPQSNEQPALFTAENFVANNLFDADAAGVLLTEETAVEEVAVAQFVSTDNLPEGATVEFAMDMAGKEDFSDAVAVKVTNRNNIAYAAKGDLQAAYIQIHGKNPEAHVVNVRYAAYVVTGKEKVRVNGLDTYYGAAVATVTSDPGFRMEQAYYMVWSDDPETMSLDNAERIIKLDHSEKDVYDDTKFFKIMEIPDEAAGNFYWLIVPQSLLDAGTLEGAYGAEEGVEYELNGPLYTTTNEDYPAVAVCTEETGKYQFTVDMYVNEEEEEYASYVITPAFDNLWTPGNSNGWSHGSSNKLSTTDYIVYTGYAYLDGEFKFSNAEDWNHTNYGNSGTEGELSTDGGAGNLKAEAAGVYWCSVNIPNLTYTITKIETIGLIGGFNGWGSSLALTEEVTGTTQIKYTGTFEVISVENGGNEFKFRANDGWDINLGGTSEELIQGGDNLTVSEVGMYDVVLDLSTLPYTCTVTKK